jgi:hypothetical protein
MRKKCDSKKCDARQNNLLESTWKLHETDAFALMWDFMSDKGPAHATDFQIAH